MARAIGAEGGDRPAPTRHGPPASGHPRPRGGGLRRRIPGHLGGPARLRQRNLSEPAELAGVVAGWTGRGAAVFHVVRDGQVVGALTLEDEIRPSHEAVDQLHRLGIRLVMITGDAWHVAERSAPNSASTRCWPRSPRGQGAAVADLEDRGFKVAMVGDGVNDARPSPGPTWAWQSAPAPTWPSSRPGSSWSPRTPGPSSASSGCPGPATARWCRTWLGADTTWWPSPSPPASWPGPAWPFSPAVGAILMSVSTIVVALNAQLLRRVDLSPDRV